jgi:LysM repeat protein
MIDNHRVNFSLVASLLLLCFTHVVQSASIWRGDSGQLSIRWTETDIIAAKGKILFSAKALAKKDFEADFFVDQSLGKENPCKYQRNFTLLSVVGSIATLEDTQQISCQSLLHPSVDKKFMAIDFAQSGQVVALTDFFAESDILKALLADAIIKKALSGLKTPSTLTALYNTLEWAEISVNDCEYALSEDFLTRFAFYHMSRNKVAVRLDLSPMGNACSNTQLGFYLPIPADLKKALYRAKRKWAGFLMERSEKIAGKKSMKVSFSTATYQKTVPVRFPVLIETSETAKYHSVAAGEYLIKIARLYGHNYREIAAWNALKPPYNLHRGQRLLVSAPIPVIPIKISQDDGQAKNVVQERMDNDKKIVSNVSEEPTEELVKQRISIASGINVRAAPRLRARRVGKLNFGTVVKELARSEQQVTIGGATDYWYKIEMPNGKTGWTFGSLSIPFEPKLKGEIYLQITTARRQGKLNWFRKTKLLDFLAQVKEEVPSESKSAAELTSVYLSLLQEMLDELFKEDKQKKYPYRVWLKKQKQQEIISEVDGNWLINSKLMK